MLLVIGDLDVPIRDVYSMKLSSEWDSKPVHSAPLDGTQSSRRFAEEFAARSNSSIDYAKYTTPGKDPWRP